MSISLKPLNVWLVDDDASIRWVLERALRQGGMSPTAFDQADSALAALRRDRPDVLITDIRMPGRSGLELLTQIRASQPELPVIVMTAHSDLDSAVAAYQGGAFEYLPKPFDIDQAVDLVPEQLGLQQVRGERRSVERNEGLRRARAVSMQRACVELLAGARLAGDQHRHAGA